MPCYTLQAVLCHATLSRLCCATLHSPSCAIDHLPSSSNLSCWCCALLGAKEIVNKCLAHTQKSMYSCAQVVGTYLVNPLHYDFINPLHSDFINPLHSDFINPPHSDFINPLHSDFINPLHSDFICVFYNNYVYSYNFFSKINFSNNAITISYSLVYETAQLR